MRVRTFTPISAGSKFTTEPLKRMSGLAMPSAPQILRSPIQLRNFPHTDPVTAQIGSVPQRLPDSLVGEIKIQGSPSGVKRTPAPPAVARAVEARSTDMK